ncbi:snf2 family N-terminal domain-containing protein [Cyclospora cayetanensis]|uniref:Snf2 family N-terminal domain-containing protein n=1 Tax=Cyclospora cayetanensis TaxID=88456 RepID=A0A1D3D2S1_9EIME|nr:snf2 family N-terminal domain-containing protein [Cyclospora cayetanensis]
MDRGWKPHQVIRGASPSTCSMGPPAAATGVILSSREGVVAAACCIGNQLADVLPPFVMGGAPDDGAKGERASRSFTRSFLRLQQKFHGRAEQLQVQQQQQQQQESTACNGSARPLHWPEGDAAQTPSNGECTTVEGADDLNIDGVISALLDRSHAGVEPLSSEQIHQQLRLQLLATRYLQQGRPPPPALMHAIAAALPDSVREEMITRPALMLQLAQQLKIHSREHVLQQLDERKRLLDCVLSEDPKIRERFSQICYLPDDVRRVGMVGDCHGNFL